MKGHLRSMRWLYTVFVVTAAALAGAWYQDETPASSELPAPTIRVSTHLVLVDAVVTDKQGKAIQGLRPEDFVVEENGKAQKISLFVAPAENHGGEPAALPPGVYSNKPEYRSPGGPIMVILLDALNTAYQDQSYARGQMLKFVQEQYMPGQRMAILTLTGSLNVLQDFTSDPQTLYTALQRYKPVPQTFTSAASPPASGAGSNAESPLGRSGATILINNAVAAIEGFSQVQAAYAEDQRAILTLNALNSLARILGGLPGRKNVIWVTGNAPFPLILENRAMSAAELEEDLPSLNTRRAYEHAAGNYAATFREAHANEIRGTAARLASAQVALYPLDARGLSISLSIDSQETMRELARETGGRAYVNQNEIKGGVERAFSDILATYTLGYYPQNKKYDGEYRQIRIKAKRDGVEVQSRNGYYALDPTQAKDYNPNQEVAAAARDVIPATQVSFSARVQPPDANASAAGKVGVDFLVDANTLSVEDTSGGKRLSVDFFALVFSAEGRMIANRNIKVDKTFDASTYQQILQHGLPLHMDLDPQPGKNQLRLAVRDNQSGMVGTVIAPMS